MKRIVLLIILTSFISLPYAAVWGAQKGAENSNAKVTSDDVKKEPKEAMDTAKAYTLQQKEEYQQKMEAKLQDFDREIQEMQDKVKSKASELKEESKAKYNQAMEALQQKKQEASEKLDELKSATGKAWDDTKAGVDSAMDELGKAYDRVRSHFE